jgi:hypothetical protein
LDQAEFFAPDSQGRLKSFFMLCEDRVNSPRLSLSILPERFAVCRLSPDDDVPPWGRSPEFYSITRSREELSVVCLAKDVPGHIQADRDWRVLKIEGPLSFSLTGILISLANPLAEAKISIFAISTYDTDYVLVPESSLPRATAIFMEKGHSIHR